MWAAGKKSHVEGVSEEVSTNSLKFIFYLLSGEGFSEEVSTKIFNSSSTSSSLERVCGSWQRKNEEVRTNYIKFNFYSIS
jgi:hypothetical protein